MVQTINYNFTYAPHTSPLGGEQTHGSKPNNNGANRAGDRPAVPGRDRFLHAKFERQPIVVVVACASILALALSLATAGGGGTSAANWLVRPAGRLPHGAVDGGAGDVGVRAVLEGRGTRAGGRGEEQGDAAAGGLHAGSTACNNSIRKE